MIDKCITPEVIQEKPDLAKGMVNLGAVSMGCGCLLILLFPLIMLVLFLVAVAIDPLTH